MRSSLVFVHPVTYTQRSVRVGPDHLLLVVGALCGLVRLVDVVGGLELPWAGYLTVALLAHARQWRHATSWPMLGSLALAATSYGVSSFVSGILINRLIAQRLRDAGWKIRNTDGQLGEYSSRFLAVDRMGFSESDLMDEVVRRHLSAELVGGGAVPQAEPRPGLAPRSMDDARVGRSVPTPM